MLIALQAVQLTIRADTPAAHVQRRMFKGNGQLTFT